MLDLVLELCNSARAEPDKKGGGGGGVVTCQTYKRPVAAGRLGRVTVRNPYGSPSIPPLVELSQSRHLPPKNFCAIMPP